MRRIDVYGDPSSSFSVCDPFNVAFDENTKTFTFSALESDYSKPITEYNTRSWAFSNVAMEAISDSGILLSSLVIHSGTGRPPQKINIHLSWSF